MRLKFPALLGLALTLCASTLVGLGTAHAAPARDPKTGKFMKSPKATPTPSAMKMKMAPKMKAKMASKPKKAMPPRDPKTGRFMKKGAAPAPTAKAKM